MISDLLFDKACAAPAEYGFKTILFSRDVDQAAALQLIEKIQELKASGSPGVHVSIHSGGGVPTNAAAIYSVLKSVEFPAISHVIGDAFSEAAALAIAFPFRTISPTGRIGFHQAAMKIDAGQYHQAKISDLLSQIKSLNEIGTNLISYSTGVSIEDARKWIFEGIAFCGVEAERIGIVHKVLCPSISHYDIKLVA